MSRQNKHFELCDKFNIILVQLQEGVGYSDNGMDDTVLHIFLLAALSTVLICIKSASSSRANEQMQL